MVNVKKLTRKRDISVIHAKGDNFITTPSEGQEEETRKRAERIANHASESEKSIERYLARRVAEIRGLCLKFASATQTGYPDRLVVLPGGMSCWVELKSKEQTPTRLQDIRHEELRRRGHVVYVVDSRERVDELVKRWKGGYL